MYLVAHSGVASTGGDNNGREDLNLDAYTILSYT